MIFEPEGESPIYVSPDDGAHSLQECELPKPTAIDKLNTDFLVRVASYVEETPESAGHSLFRRYGTMDVIREIAALQPDDTSLITLRTSNYAHRLVGEKIETFEVRAGTRGTAWAIEEIGTKPGFIAPRFEVMVSREEDLTLHVPQAVAFVNQALFDKSLDLKERYARLCASCGIPFTAMVHIVADGKENRLIEMMNEESFRTRVAEISGGKYTMPSKGHARIIKDVFTHCPSHFTGFNAHFLRSGENLSGLWLSKDQIELLREISITQYPRSIELLNSSFDGVSEIIVGGRNVSLIIALPSALERRNIGPMVNKRVRIQDVQKYWAENPKKEEELRRTVYPQFLTCYTKGALFKRIGPD